MLLAIFARQLFLHQLPGLLAQANQRQDHYTSDGYVCGLRLVPLHLGPAVSDSVQISSIAKGLDHGANMVQKCS